MKVLVTGGAGFIGSNLIEKFLELEALVEKIMILDSLTYAANIQFINKEVYQNLLTSLSVGDNIENGHFTERIWAHLFTQIKV